MLFEVRDAPLAQLIANDSVLRKFCTVTGEVTLVIPAKKEAAFRRRLVTAQPARNGTQIRADTR
jgi:hypothetical protein